MGCNRIREVVVASGQVAAVDCISKSRYTGIKLVDFLREMSCLSDCC